MLRITRGFLSPAGLAALLTALLAPVSLAWAQANGAQTNAATLDHYQQGQLESMIDRAAELVQSGDLDTAEDHFLEALQISKASFGFDSLQQLPALGGLIRTRQRQERWESMNRLLEYHGWVVQQNRSSNLDDYLSGLRLLSDLYLELAGNTHNPDSGLHLISAKNLNWRAVTALETEYGRSDPQLVPWLYRIVLAHFHQSTLTKRRGMTSYNFKTDSPGIVSGWSLSKQESVRKSYGIGQELLARIRSIRASSKDLWSQAIATVYQGDWELLFDDQNAALNYYNQALALLETGNIPTAEINAFFDRTVVLPDSQAPGLASAVPADESNTEFVAWSDNFPGAGRPLLFTVSGAKPEHSLREGAVARFLFDLAGQMRESRDTGLPAAVSKVVVDSMEPDNPLARQLALRYFSQLQLRPRFVDGVQQQVNGLSLFYRFPGDSRLVQQVDAAFASK